MKKNASFTDLFINIQYYAIKGFFHESSSPKHLKITLGLYKFFLKFADIFASQGSKHRYERHRWQICHRCQQHQRQILPLVTAGVVDKKPEVENLWHCPLNCIQLLYSNNSDTIRRVVLGLSWDFLKFSAWIAYSETYFLSYIHLGSSVCLSSCHIPSCRPVILSSCHICGTLSYSFSFCNQNDQGDETEGLVREGYGWRDRKETDQGGRVWTVKRLIIV